MLPYQSEFYTACKLGDQEGLRSLVDAHRGEMEAGSDQFSAVISLPLNRQGHTLLHVACEHTHNHLVQYLLDIGCDPSIGSVLMPDTNHGALVLCSLVQLVTVSIRVGHYLLYC